MNKYYVDCHVTCNNCDKMLYDFVMAENKGEAKRAFIDDICNSLSEFLYCVKTKTTIDVFFDETELIMSFYNFTAQEEFVF